MAYTPDDKDRDLLSELERRARERAEADDTEEDAAPDLIDALRSDDEIEAEPPDATVIGYVERHDRPPAFTGSDGQPYTVDVDVEPTEDPERPYAAYFVFVRWAETGAGIMGHVDSDDIAYGATEDEARIAALESTLHEAKAALDAAIERRRRALEE